MTFQMRPHPLNGKGKVIQGYFPGGVSRILQLSTGKVGGGLGAPSQPVRERGLSSFAKLPVTPVAKPSIQQKPRLGQSVLPKMAMPLVQAAAAPRLGAPQRPPIVQPMNARLGSSGLGAVQRKSDTAFPLPPTFRFKPFGSGQRLPESVQQKMESYFKTSFEDVRVHVGPEAASIGALAFTYGTDLYFSPGQYNPGTIQGQQLLGHELTHVVQQRAGRVRNPLGNGVAVVQDYLLESEADRMGRQAASIVLPVQRR